MQNEIETTGTAAAAQPAPALKKVPTIRQVVDGETLSGHGREADGYPEILILDRPKGSLMCSIESFHWATVKVTPKGTELWFEGKTCLIVTGGVVEISHP